MSQEKKLIPEFTKTIHYKRKYQEKMKIPCINCSLVKIANDCMKVETMEKTIYDTYLGESIPLHFSKYLTEKFSTYIYPTVINEIWPMITSVLRYLYYDEIIWNFNNDIILTVEKNVFENIGKEYRYLKRHGYNPCRIPEECLRH